MTPSTPAIEFRAVCKAYEDHRVLDRINLTLHQGSTFCLMGRNGAGKTTAIHLLLGLRNPTSGRILIRGVETASPEIHRIRRSVGYLPDAPILYEHLTGREFLRFIGELYGIDANARIRVEERIDRLCLDQDIDSLIATYSLGMKKKLSLLAALTPDPEILVLDEPTSGLDAFSAREVKAIMREYRDRKRLVLFTTHDLEVAELLSDQIGILHAGRLLFVGSIQELRSTCGRIEDEPLEEIFVRITDESGGLQTDESGGLHADVDRSGLDSR